MKQENLMDFFVFLGLIVQHFSRLKIFIRISVVGNNQISYRSEMGIPNIALIESLNLSLVHRSHNLHLVAFSTP